MKKAIFIDLDGTLLDDNRDISGFNKNIIEMLKKTYDIYLITGMHYDHSIRFITELQLDTPLISSSGQEITDTKTNKVLFSWYFNDDDFNPVKESVEEIFAVKNFIIDARDGQYILDESQRDLLDILERDNHKPFKGNIKDALTFYFEVEWMDKKDLLAKVKHLNRKWIGRYTFSYWDTDAKYPVVVVQPFIADKATAMERLRQVKGYECIIAIGNGWTDRNMIVGADLGIAMINSAPEIQKRADMVTEYDNNHSGVGIILEKIITDL